MTEDLKIARIEGTITLTNGTTSQFCLSKNGEWQQWGNTTDNMRVGAEALEQIVNALYDEDLLSD